jgi:hypothetical protein
LILDRDKDLRLIIFDVYIIFIVLHFDQLYVCECRTFLSVLEKNLSSRCNFQEVHV